MKKALFVGRMMKSYFTIQNDKSTTLYISLGDVLSHTVKISINNGSWEDISSTLRFELPGKSCVRISRMCNNGDAFRIRCHTNSNYNTLATDINTYSISVYGNIMSLLYGDDFFTNTETMNYSLFDLFYGNEVLTDASRLVLPAINLVDDAYSRMFSGCSNLNYPPKVLPAKYGPYQCYHSMFTNCTSLCNAPIILLTEKTDYTTSYGNQCAYMFANCTSLRSIDIYFAIPGVGMGASRPGAATDDMLAGCTSLTEVNLRASLLQQNCYNVLFGSSTFTQEITVNIFARSFDVDNLSSGNILTRYFSSFPNSSNFKIYTYSDQNENTTIVGEQINEAFRVGKNQVVRGVINYDPDDLSDNTPPEVNIEP